MTANHETIHLRIEACNAWIMLDRPSLNVLDIAMTEALGAALERALPKSDFVVFQSAGTKAFCAGADVVDHTPERVGKMLRAFYAVFRRLVAADCLTIAAVRGHCLGGGMELAISAILFSRGILRNLGSRKSSSAAFLPWLWRCYLNELACKPLRG